MSRHGCAERKPLNRTDPEDGCRMKQACKLECGENHREAVIAWGWNEARVGNLVASAKAESEWTRSSDVVRRIKTLDR